MANDLAKDIALLKQSDTTIIERIKKIEDNQEVQKKISSDHEQADQKRHIEIIKGHAEVKEVILTKFSLIEKYVDIKIKEQQLWIEENYTKKIEHQNLQKDVTKLETELQERVGKIESVFTRLWRIVFGFIVLAIMAVLFDKS